MHPIKDTSNKQNIGNNKIFNFTIRSDCNTAAKYMYLPAFRVRVHNIGFNYSCERYETTLI